MSATNHYFPASQLAQSLLPVKKTHSLTSVHSGSAATPVFDLCALVNKLNRRHLDLYLTKKTFPN